ncbi:hypothetical protein QBC32DRAFT_24291 [Pseudoneurospora amorphoporcata]|uniref:Mid2 domain-containing protein n=1 Tax=Pseudoneurospora amorphoporcata TaxID=241081 RepID=A0AAN6SDY6_9PEZI|nr:hypothetical protein QBC32DRAFT_24291 [Pseudoneurospora amorphoporcata]
MTNHIGGPSLSQARKTMNVDHSHTGSSAGHNHRHLHHQHNQQPRQLHSEEELDLDQTPHQHQHHTHTHTHNHNLKHNHARYHHQQQSSHEDSDNTPQNLDIRSPLDTTTHQQQSEPGLLNARSVLVVQTVSVIKIIDDAGALVHFSTLASEPVTQSPDPVAVLTADVRDLGSQLPTLSVSVPGLGDGTPSPTASVVTESSITSAILSLPSGVSAPGALTSALFNSSSVSHDDGASSFPTLSLSSGLFNSSSTRVPSFYANGTHVSHSLFSNTTRTSTFASSTSTFASSTKSRASTTRFTATSSGAPTLVAGGTGGGNSGNEGAGGESANPAGATDSPYIDPDNMDSNSSGLTPTAQRSIIGGVVGGAAGMALIAFLLLFLLKWKKRNGGGNIRLLGEGGTLAAAARKRGGHEQGGGALERGGGSGGGGGGNGRGGGMTERGLPYAVPSALASLTGAKRFSTASTEPPVAERGFYRVSGKKLISVLESGGDGYSDPDPHESVYYRDSMAFTDGTAGALGLGGQRLKLGSPMRPISGVPVFRSGPGRTAIVQQDGGSPGVGGTSPFSDDTHPVTPTSPIGSHGPPSPPARASLMPDPIGRSLASRDGSRGSGSRFTEDM